MIVFWIVLTLLITGVVYAGLLVTALEMKIIDKCEACGRYFRPKHGYIDLEYSYCSKCCKW